MGASYGSLQGTSRFLVVGLQPVIVGLRTQGDGQRALQVCNLEMLFLGHWDTTVGAVMTK